MSCAYCHAIRRRLLLWALAWLPAGLAFGRAPPGSDPDSVRAKWFSKQVNMLNGSCCKLGDGHELDPGDVRYDADTGLWSVRLPDPSVETFGHGLNEPSDKPKVWVTVQSNNMRNPDGGPPPGIVNPIVWYDTTKHAQSMYPGLGNEPPSIIVFCFDPNTML